MQNENEAKLTREPPTHRLWMVEDRENADPEWTELAMLWPTKKGTGFTGRLEKTQAFSSGFRLVILPAKGRKQGGAA